MAAKNDILRDKDGNQIFPATMAEQVSYDGKINVKQAIKRGAVRNKVAPTVASMTDKEQIYVYTGTEEGYTFGNWYYWDGTAWTSGGAYNAIEVNTDGTLTEEGAPADAKATGDKLSELKGDLVDLGEVAYRVEHKKRLSVPVGAFEIAFPTFARRKYRIMNEGTSGRFTLHAYNNDTKVSTISEHGVANGTSVVYEPTMDGNKLKGYANADTVIYAYDEQSLFDEVNSNKENITFLKNDLSIIAEDVLNDYKTMFTWSNGTMYGGSVGTTEKDVIHTNLSKITKGTIVSVNGGVVYKIYTYTSDGTLVSYDDTWYTEAKVFDSDCYVRIALRFNDNRNVSAISDFEGHVHIGNYDNYRSVLNIVDIIRNGTVINVAETGTVGYYYTPVCIPKNTECVITNTSESTSFTFRLRNETKTEEIGDLSAGQSVKFTASIDALWVGGYFNKEQIAFTLELKGLSDIPKNVFNEEINDSVAKLKEHSKEKAYVFALATDTHHMYDTNDFWSDTIQNIRQVHKLYPLDAIYHLGDIIEGNAEKEITESLMEEVRNSMLSVTENSFISVGNHDDNHVYYNINGTGQLTEADRYSLLSRYNDKKVVRENTNPYYYFDVENMGLRVIVLCGFLGDGYTGNNGNSWGYTDEQLSWLQNKALNTDKQVLLFSHVSASNDSNGGIAVVNGAELTSILNQFVLDGGVVVGLFHGHTHRDILQKYDGNSFYEIGTGTANPNQDTTLTREKNTVTQELWDLVVIRPQSRTVKMVRFGAGSDREFSY